MAKSDKLKTDPFNIDSELDFDNFDIGSLDGSMNPEVKNKKSRKPVTDVFKGTVGGAKDRFKDPSFLTKVLRDSLPSGYGEVFKTTDKVGQTATSLYDEAVKELKPQLGRIAQKVDKLVPESSKRIKRMTSSISKRFEADTRSFTSLSSEQIQDQGVSNMLASVFAAQQEMQAQSEARTTIDSRVRDQIEAKRFQSNFGVLGSINENLQRISSYTERVTQAYQKKSLELQYRSYFVQNQLLQMSSKYYEVFKVQNEAIARHTGLPEYAKVTAAERFKDMARNKFMDKFQNSLFGKDSAIDKMLGRLREDASLFIRGTREALGAAMFGLDMAADQKNNLDAMGDMLDEESKSKMSAGHMVGEAAGGMIMDWLGGIASGKLKGKIEGNKGLMKGDAKLRHIFANPAGAAKSARNSKKMQEWKKGNVGQKGAAWIADFILGGIRDSAPDMTVKGNDTIRNGGLGAAFDTRTQRSIVEVIPGYLSRILREVTVLRTGDNNTGEIIFDQGKGKFVQKSQMSDSIRGTFKKKIKSSSYDFFLDQAAGSSGLKAKGADKDKAKKFLANLSTELNTEFTPQNVFKSEHFKTLDRDTRKIVGDMLREQLIASPDKEDNQAKFSENIMKVRQNTADFRRDIEQMVNAGYAEILEEQGIITQNEDGDYKIDEKQYFKILQTEGISDGAAPKDDEDSKYGVRSKALKRLMKREMRKASKSAKDMAAGKAQSFKDSIAEKARKAQGSIADSAKGFADKMSGIVKSDMHAKENVKGFSGKSALDAIKKTKVFSWFYKKGKGDRRQHAGPMAQHVQQNSGNDAAPGGTKIDLTSMNGQNMAAIQELAKQQESMMKGEDKSKHSAMDAIAADTAKLVQLVALISAKAGSGGGGGGGQGFSGNGYSSHIANILGSGAKIAGKAAMDIGRTGLKTAKLLKTGAVAGTKAMRAGYNMVKDPIKAGLMNLLSYGFEGGKKLGSMAFAGAKMLPGAIMKGANFLNDAKDWGIDTGKKLLAKAQDVYVKGEKEPIIRAKLLKAGYYFDQATGKVIRTMGDLKRLKGNIVNKRGEVILTQEDAAKGLVDAKGEPIKTIFDKLGILAKAGIMKGFGRGFDFMKAAFPIGSKLIGKGAEMLKGLFENGFGLSLGFGNKKIHKVLVEIRDLLKKKLSGGSAFGGSAVESSESESEPGQTKAEFEESFVGPKPQSFGSKMKEKGKGLFGRLGSLGKKTKLGAKIGSIAAGAKSLFGKKKTANKAAAASEGKEAETSGRKGGVDERTAAIEAKHQAHLNGVQEADKKIRYGTEGNIIDSMMGKLSGIMDFATKGLGSIFGAAGSAISTAMGAIGIGGKGGGLLGKIGGALGGTAKGVAGAAGTVGKGALGVTKFAGRMVGAAGKAAMFAARNPVAVFNGVRNVAMAASMLTGGVGSAALGAIGTGLTAIGGILSSPVVLGALAVAAVGYGAYKLYKYVTRDNVNDFENIRMKQYGLGESDKNLNHHMLQLEEYLTDGKIGYPSGRADIIDKKVENKELLEIFSIDENDQDMCQRFAHWYSARFKPFFLTHLTALYSVDPKIALKDVSKLQPADQIKYLGLIGYDGGPYNIATSPFKTREELTTGKELALKLITALTEKINDTIKKGTDKKATTAAPVKPQAGIVVKPAEKEKPAAPIPKIDQSKQGDSSGGDPFSGEEGKETVVSDKLVRGSAKGGYGKLKLADGDLRDGAGADQYMKLAPGVSLNGLHPSLLKNLRAMVQEYGERTGKTVTITSGARSSAQQAALYAKDPSKAAKPGNSMHEFGLAVDVNSTDLDAMEEAGLMRKYGFTRPVGGEPWHMEAAGTQINLAKAKTDAQFASQAIESSLYKGGGGLGIMDDVRKGSRDASVALALMDAGAQKVNDNSDSARAQAVLKPSSDMPKTAANDSSMKTASAPSSAGAGRGTGALAAQSAQFSKNSSLPDGESKPTAVAANSGGTGPIDSSNKEEVKNAIMSIAQKQGADPNEIATIAAVESSMNPNARAGNTTAAGPFQFLKTSWNEQMGKHARKYGIDPNTSPTDINASTIMATEYVKSNRKALSSVKANPNLTDVYLAHFLGASGAKKFLSAKPDDIAATIVPAAAKSNPNIFYSNGKALTVAEVYSKIDAKLSKAASSYGINLRGGNTFEAKTTAANDSKVATIPKSAGTTPSVPDGGSRSAPAVSRPAPIFGSAPSTAISSNDRASVPQGITSGANDMSSVNNTLIKQLDVQTQMLEMLKKIAGSLSPEQLKSLMDNMKPAAPEAPAFQNSRRGPQTVSSTIDLSRKIA